MYFPFTDDIPNERMEQAAFAFLCQNQKWFTWPKFKKQFQTFKELYFGKQSWIVNPIERSILWKIDQNPIEGRREHEMALILMVLQQRQNNAARLYWGGSVRRQLNSAVNRIWITFNNGDKTKDEVEAERKKFTDATEAVMDDALTDFNFTNLPVPKMLKEYCKLYIKEMKGDELYLLSDEMEENGLLAEAEHFRQGIHTWACPVLRRLAGVTSGVMK